MVQIDIPDEQVEQLLELADMLGLHGAIEDILPQIIDRAYNLISQTGDDTSSIEPSQDVESALNHVMGRCILSGGEFTGEAITQEVEPKKRWTWEQLKEFASGDKLIESACELDSLQQQALADLYNELPSEFWGSIKAAELWQRQIAFMRARSGG